MSAFLSDELTEAFETVPAFRHHSQIGEARALRRTILKLGIAKLGTPTPEQAMELGTIDDVARLDRMVDRFGRIKSWKTLLRTA